MTTMKVGNLTMQWDEGLVLRDSTDQAKYRNARVIEAAPLIEVSREWVERVLAMQETCARDGINPIFRLESGVLTINSVNRDQLIYREMAYDHQRDTYLFCWPD